MKVLVDTPVWSLALRTKPRAWNVAQRTAATSLQELITEGRAQIIGPVRQELLCGFRDPSEYLILRDNLRNFTDSPLETEDYEEAARIYNLCRSAGITGSSVDLLISAVAHRRQWQILTLDKDFERYAKHVPLALYRPT